MRHSLVLALACAGIVATVALPGAPARADDLWLGPRSDLVVTGPRPRVDNRAWDDVRYQRAPLGQRQIEADKVQQMARELQRSIGAAYPGEDALGAGTSITH